MVRRPARVGMRHRDHAHRMPHQTVCPQQSEGFSQSQGKPQSGRRSAQGDTGYRPRQGNDDGLHSRGADDVAFDHLDDFRDDGTHDQPLRICVV